MVTWLNLVKWLNVCLGTISVYGLEPVEMTRRGGDIRTG